MITEGFKIPSTPHRHPGDRAEKRLRMRAVDCLWRIFDRLSTLNDVVPMGDSLAITTFDKMELDEF